MMNRELMRPERKTGCFTDRNPETAIRHTDPAHFFMSAETIWFAPDFEGMRFSIAQPRSGMSVFMCQGTPMQDISIPFSVAGDGTITFSVIFSSLTKYSTENWKPAGCALDAARPQTLIFTSAACEGRVRMEAGRPQCYVGVHLSFERLQEMLGAESLHLAIRKHQRPGPGVHLLRQMPADPRSRLVASQLLACPLTGCCRRLFMEGKSLELLSSLLLQLSEDKTPKHPAGLSRGDVERLHEARRILFERMDDPPGLHALARHCGLNECKLKKGFRTLFGCTAYEALRTHRMHTARTLLLDSDMTVGTAAATVGYTNMSHFITAFRNVFGITPGLLLSETRRSAHHAA